MLQVIEGGQMLKGSSPIKSAGHEYAQRKAQRPSTAAHKAWATRRAKSQH
jgi:hypothetical protein